jgi:hypothetical protein
MSMPQMVPNNVVARLTAQINALRAEVRELRAASGTLDAATIYKGGLKIINPNTGSWITLSDAQIKVAPDDSFDQDHAGRVYGSTNPGQWGSIMINPPTVSDSPVAILDVSLQLIGVSPTFPAGRGTLRVGSFEIDVTDTSTFGPGSFILSGLPTTGSAANVRRDSTSGAIQYVTSSLRYKDDPLDAVIEPREVLQLQPRTWVDKGVKERAEPGAEIRRNVGFIAEEVDEQPSLRQFVDYDDQGRPDAIQYDRLTVALLELAKTQQTQIDALATRLDALEGGQ